MPESLDSAGVQQRSIGVFYVVTQNTLLLLQLFIVLQTLVYVLLCTFSSKRVSAEIFLVSHIQWASRVFPQLY